SGSRTATAPHRPTPAPPTPAQRPATAPPDAGPADAGLHAVGVSCDHLTGRSINHTVRSVVIRLRSDGSVVGSGEISMRKWTRWQDWVALVAGVYAILSPIWTDTDTAATWTMIVLGVLLTASAVWALAMPTAVASEWSHAIV